MFSNCLFSVSVAKGAFPGLYCLLVGILILDIWQIITSSIYRKTESTHFIVSIATIIIYTACRAALLNNMICFIHILFYQSIQVGDGEPQEEVLMMCDDPTNQHFYKVRDYTELVELKERLLASLCDGK